MSKITLVVVLLMVFFSGSAQATLWVERCSEYQPQSDFNCAVFESVENEFGWEEYQDIAENGSVEEINKLISSYEKMAWEYEFLENKIGGLFYRMIILSLKTALLEISGLENGEYERILQESDEKKEEMNNLISQCGFSWE